MTDTMTPDAPANEAASGDRFVTLSANAARRIAQLRQIEGDDAMMLRITVSGGGCSGFQYGFDFDTALNEDDHTFERDGVTVVIDDVSLELLNQSEVDFVEDLLGSYFVVKNPNATSSCGCGSSFAI